MATACPSSPLAAEHYLDARLWADDVAAVIDRTGLDAPVLVAWSYGGFVVADYIRAYGDGGIAGLNLVGSAVMLKPPAFEHFGPGLLENAPAACAADLANITAIQRFLDACTAQPLSPTSGRRRCAGTWSSRPRCGAP